MDEDLGLALVVDEGAVALVVRDHHFGEALLHVFLVRTHAPFYDLTLKRGH